MRVSHLAVVLSTKGLPQNTEQARAMVWAKASRLLRRDLGTLYDSFYPSPRSWEVDIRTSFGVVLGREDPARFLTLFFRAREKRKAALSFHVSGAVIENGFDKLQQVGDTLICPVLLDGTNKNLEGHIYWQEALARGAILPDCGVYFAERMRSSVEPGMEKVIESNPADYALCVVILENREAQE